MQVRWIGSTGLRLAWKQARFSLSKRSYDEIIVRLQRNNRFLTQFANRSVDLELSRRKRCHLSTLQQLGDSAKSVYNALQASFECGCAINHNALLCLSTTSTSPKRAEDLDGIDFRVVLSARVQGTALPNGEINIWQETRLQTANYQLHPSPSCNQSPTVSSSQNQSVSQVVTAHAKPFTKKRLRFVPSLRAQPALTDSIRTQTTNTLSLSPPSTASSSQNQPVISSTSPSAMHTSSIPNSDVAVPSICAKIYGTGKESNETTGCMGYITDGSRRFLIFPLARSEHSGKPWSTVSLHHILRNNLPSVLPLTPWDKVTLAAIVASAVLQLHQTPWLKTTWDHDDIVFLKREGQRLYNQAFVAKQVSKSNKTEPSRTFETSMFNQTLLTLGIVLVELSLGPLEKLQTAEDLCAGPYANMVTVWRLVENDEIGVAFGPRYQAAVKKCVELAKASTSLDNSLRQDFYDGVVSVLEDQAARKTFVV
jgi:hypothetical protein